MIKTLTEAELVGFLSRLLGPGVVLLSIGVSLILLATVFEHYDLHRSQWYIGECGLAALGIGGVVAFVAAMLQLLPEPATAPHPEDAGDG